MVGELNFFFSSRIRFRRSKGAREVAQATPAAVNLKMFHHLFNGKLIAYPPTH